MNEQEGKSSCRLICTNCSNIETVFFISVSFLSCQHPYFISTLSPSSLLLFHTIYFVPLLNETKKHCSLQHHIRRCSPPAKHEIKMLCKKNEYTAKEKLERREKCCTYRLFYALSSANSKKTQKVFNLVFFSHFFLLLPSPFFTRYSMSKLIIACNRRKRIHVIFSTEIENISCERFPFASDVRLAEHVLVPGNHHQAYI